MGDKIGGDACYDAALPDEPMFVLLARDASAPTLVLEWAHRREMDVLDGLKPQEDMAKVDEARAQARRMKAWRNINMDLWRKGTKTPHQTPPRAPPLPER